MPKAAKSDNQLSQAPAADTHRRNSWHRGYDLRWRKFVHWYKRRHYQCVMCGKWIQEGQGDKHVDHIIPLVDGGSHCDPENSQLLCRRCHNKKTEADRRKSMRSA